MNKEPERKQHKNSLNKLSLQKQISKTNISLVCKVCCNSLPNTKNEAGFRGIKTGMVNVDNYANRAASVHLTHLCLT